MSLTVVRLTKVPHDIKEAIRLIAKHNDESMGKFSRRILIDLYHELESYDLPENTTSKKYEIAIFNVNEQLVEDLEKKCSELNLSISSLLRYKLLKVISDAPDFITTLPQ